MNCETCAYFVFDERIVIAGFGFSFLMAQAE